MVRIKNRYLLVNILYPDPPDQNKTPSSKPSSTAQSLPAIIQFHRPTPDDLTLHLFTRALKEQIALLYGDYGVGVTSSGLTVKYLSSATSTAIIRCPRAHYRLVWAALTYMTHLPTASKKSTTMPRPCVFQVVRVSGTIRKSEEEAIRRARDAIMRAKRKDEEDGGGMMGLQALLRGSVEDEGFGVRRTGTGAGIEDEDEDDEDDDGDEEVDVVSVSG